MATLAEHAAAKALMLQLELTDRREVIAWVYETMGRAQHVDFALIDVLDATYVVDIIDALNRVAGTVRRYVVGRLVLGDLHVLFQRDRAQLGRIARALYQMAHKGYAPDSAAEDEMFRLEDEYDLVLSGCRMSLDNVADMLAKFLSHYGPAAAST